MGGGPPALPLLGDAGPVVAPAFLSVGMPPANKPPSAGLPPPPPPLPPLLPLLAPPPLGFSFSMAGALLSTVWTFLSPPLNPLMAPSSAPRPAPPAGAGAGGPGAGGAEGAGGAGGAMGG